MVGACAARLSVGHVSGRVSVVATLLRPPACGGPELEKDPDHQSQKNATGIAERRAELTAYVTAHHEEIACGERMVFFGDECLLLWGDACGSVWGNRNDRVTVPVGNVRARQASYGAMDMVTGITHLVPYATADARPTTGLLVDLQLRFPHGSGAGLACGGERRDACGRLAAHLSLGCTA